MQRSENWLNLAVFETGAMTKKKKECYCPTSYDFDVGRINSEIVPNIQIVTLKISTTVGMLPQSKGI
jgi:hypothetical protein